MSLYRPLIAIFLLVYTSHRRYNACYVCPPWISYVNCRTRAISRAKFVGYWNVSWYIPVNTRKRKKLSTHTMLQIFLNIGARKFLRILECKAAARKKERKEGKSRNTQWCTWCKKPPWTLKWWFHIFGLLLM